MEYPLCWLFEFVGITRESVGSVPAAASERICGESTSLFAWEV